MGSGDLVSFPSAEPMADDRNEVSHLSAILVLRHDFAFIYHLLHGSASNVVRTGRSVNGNRPKLVTFMWNIWLGDI
jgi:hypothetical protein